MNHYSFNNSFHLCNRQVSESDSLIVNGHFPLGVNGTIWLGQLPIPENGNCLDVGDQEQLLSVTNGEVNFNGNGIDSPTLFGQATIMAQLVFLELSFCYYDATFFFLSIFYYWRYLLTENELGF